MKGIVFVGQGESNIIREPMIKAHGEKLLILWHERFTSMSLDYQTEGPVYVLRCCQCRGHFETGEAGQREQAAAGSKNQSHQSPCDPQDSCGAVAPNDQL